MKIFGSDLNNLMSRTLKPKTGSTKVPVSKSIMQAATNERNIETINNKNLTYNITKAVWEREAKFPPSSMSVPFITIPLIQSGSIDNSNKFKVQIGSRTITRANKEKKQMLEQVFSRFSKKIHVHLYNSTNSEVLEIENKMKELGVNVTFEDDLETAKEILAVCEKLKAKGIELPKEIILMTPQEESILGYTPSMQKGHEKNAKIFLAKGLGKNKDTSDPFFKEIGQKHFTDPTPAGTFTHELGHWHHLQDRLPDEEAEKVWTSFVTDENQFDIAKKCSAHAIVDPTGKEFVAEIYAGMLNGETYDEEIMNIYRALKGPKIQ